MDGRARRRGGGRLAAMALSTVLAACAALPWIGGGPPEEAGPVPTTSPTELVRVDSRAGEWSLDAYESDRGPCVDLVGPRGERQPSCPLPGLDARGTEKPPVVVDLIDAAMAASGEDVEWVVNGVARPDVAEIRLIPAGAPAEVVVRPHLIGDGMAAVFLTVLPRGVSRFDVMAYDDSGCLLQHDQVDLRPSATAQPLEPADRSPTACPRPLEPGERTSEAMSP